jgi:acyl-CoA synthetase (AMP-forming)/AMP-acid ligase II
MTPTHRSSIADYTPAFQSREAPFLHFHRFDADGRLCTETFSRGRFWSLGARAATVIRRHGLVAGDCFVQLFGANHPADLALRLAAAMTGTVPVTVNWQADTVARMVYKIELTGARLAAVGPHFDPGVLAELTRRCPRLATVDIEALHRAPALDAAGFHPGGDPEATRIIIFTSGTTGRPKGVQLPYRAYACNRATFEDFLGIAPQDRFAVLIVNPLHHTNSTAISDWALRRAGTHLHLAEKYTTGYWRLVAEVAQRGYQRLVAPTVSRHFDFLDHLDREGRLPVDRATLMAAMARVDFLIGSAPVGPTTVGRLQHYAGRLPWVRFGSTETCLQVTGTPGQLSRDALLAAFQAGWDHRWRQEPLPGYYIGRPHPPHTAVRVVAAIDPARPGFMTDCPAGRPGYIVARGRNLMSAYAGREARTRRVIHQGWYLGLEDICFWLENPSDGQPDFYWVSRESTLMSRGGANYAYDQINRELAEFAATAYDLAPEAFDLAVVGLRRHSEHEDACCVTVELKGDIAPEVAADLAQTFVARARRRVSKGARPDYFRLAPIPRNFKGAVVTKALAADYRDHLSRSV